MPTTTPTSLRAPPPIASEELSLPAVVERRRPSVVYISTEAVDLNMFSQPMPSVGVGTGVVANTQGHLLTNNHVVEGAQRIIVALGGEEIPNTGRLLQFLATHKPGESVDVTYLRGIEEQRGQMTLAARERR